MELLCDLGPRHTGNLANEVFTPLYILRQLAEIKANVGKHIQLEISIQRPSGAFDLDFVSGFTSMYDHILNIVVRISDTRFHVFNPATARKEPGPAVMISAHYDSAIGTPAASDNVANVATVLELIRLFATQPDAYYSDLVDQIDTYRVPDSNRLHNPVIFVLGGGEETILQAAHGLITQHPWGTTIRTFVNLDAAGGGGRELVFQTGPRCPTLAYAYMRSVPYPHANTIAQDLFQTGAVPSDTDFRIYKDFGGLPGLDMAYISNGYIYHTSLDTPDRVPAGALQRTGDNLRSLLRALDTATDLFEPSPDSDSIYQGSAVLPKVGAYDDPERMASDNTMDATVSFTKFASTPLFTPPIVNGDPIFFDFLGIVGIIYSPITAFLLHGAVIMLACIYVFVPISFTHGPLIEYLQLSQKEFADGLGAIPSEDSRAQVQISRGLQRQDLEEKFLAHLPEAFRANPKVHRCLATVMDFPLSFAVITMLFAVFLCFSIAIPVLFIPEPTLLHYFVIPCTVLSSYFWFVYLLSTRPQVLTRFIRVLTPNFKVFQVHILTQCVGLGWALLSCVLAIIACALVAAFLWIINVRMVWFADQRYLFALYVPTALATILWIRVPARILPKLDSQYLISRAVRENDLFGSNIARDVGYAAAEDISFSGGISLWLALLTAAWIFGAGSAFFPAMWLTCALVGKVFLADSLLPWVVGDGEEPSNIALPHIRPDSVAARAYQRSLTCVRIRPWKPLLRALLIWLACIPAVLMTNQFAMTLLGFFIPISGRAGQVIPTDIVVGVLTAVLTAVGFAIPIAPVLSLSKRSRKVLLRILLVVLSLGLLSAILMGSPYSYERPKRMIAQHVYRVLQTPRMLRIPSPPHSISSLGDETHSGHTHIHRQHELHIANYYEDSSSRTISRSAVDPEHHSLLLSSSTSSKLIRLVGEDEQIQLGWDSIRTGFMSRGGSLPAKPHLQHAVSYSDSGIVIYALDNTQLRSLTRVYLPRLDASVVEDLRLTGPYYSSAVADMIQTETGGFYGDMPVYLPCIEFVPRYLFLPTPRPLVGISPFEARRLAVRPQRHFTEVLRDGDITPPALLNSSETQYSFALRATALPSYKDAVRVQNGETGKREQDGRDRSIATKLLTEWQNKEVFSTDLNLATLEANKIYEDLLREAGLSAKLVQSATQRFFELQRPSSVSIELLSSKWVAGCSPHLEAYFPGRQAPSPRLRLYFRVQGPAQMTMYFSSAPETVEPSKLPSTRDGKLVIAPLDITDWSLASKHSIAAFERNAAIRRGTLKSLSDDHDDGSMKDALEGQSKPPHEQLTKSPGYSIGQLTIDKTELFVLFASGLRVNEREALPDSFETYFYIDVSTPQIGNSGILPGANGDTPSTTDHTKGDEKLAELYASQTGNSGRILNRRKNTRYPRYPWCDPKSIYHLKIAIGGHNYDMITPHLVQLRRSLPDWIAPTTWTSSYLQQDYYIQCDEENEESVISNNVQ